MGPVMRREGWPERLAAVLGRPDPFVWGVNDCCLFAADAVEAMTGVDPAIRQRGYRSARAAAGRLLRHGGVEEVARGAAAALGFREIPVGFAQRGDVCLVTTAAGLDALGVVDLDGIHILVPGEAGLIAHPPDMARAAWRIG